MNINEVFKYFSKDASVKNLGQLRATIGLAADVDAKTVHSWEKLDSIPIQRQALLEVRTNGELKLDEDSR